jgi:hypothetical protein
MKKKITNIESKKEELSILLEFKPMSVNIIADRNNKEEVIEEAKKAFLKQVSEKIPGFTYYINEKNACTFENTKIGQVVKESKDKNGKLYIILNKNTKTLSVVRAISVLMNASPSVFELIDPSKYSIDDIMWQRTQWEKDNVGWSEGNTGYIVPNANDIIPIVISKSTAKSIIATIINGNGAMYRLETDKANKILFDTKKEAEEFRIKKSLNKKS